MHFPWRDRNGSIFIVGLWMLLFLGALAVAVGVVVGSRVELTRRLDLRLQGYYAAKAGVARAIVVLAADTNDWDGLGERWANSPVDFSNRLQGSIGYVLLAARGTSAGGSVTNAGLNDEMARVDINHASVALVAGLLEAVGGLGSVQAGVLAERIDRIRKAAERPRVLIAADETEARAQGAFRSIHELLLVEGIDQGLFSRIRGYVTVYGGNRVNLNTAEAGVLLAIARAADPAAERAAPAAQSLVRKVLKFRESGGIFESIIGPRMTGALAQEAELTAEEGQLLQRMSPYLTVSSDCFRGYAAGTGSNGSQHLRTIEFVWDRRQEEMLFWHER